jgi:hypothetical protein
MEDYMSVALSLETRMSRYLTHGNLLTLDSMPFLDLGEKPSTYNPLVYEGFQTFVEAESEYPDSFIIHYKGKSFKKTNLAKKYRRSSLKRHNIDFFDIEQTVLEATKFLEPYRGMVAKLERINLIANIIALLITVAGSMASGILHNWTYSLLYITLFFVVMGGIIMATKIASNKYLRQAHFALALFCRCENNRFYLERKVEIRPGFLGKWL